MPAPLWTVTRPATATVPGRRTGECRDDLGHYWHVTLHEDVVPMLRFVRDNGETYTASPNIADVLHCWRCKSGCCSHLRVAAELGLCVAGAEGKGKAKGKRRKVTA